MASTGQLRRSTTSGYFECPATNRYTDLQFSFAPKQQTVDDIRNWLENFGIHKSRIAHSDNKGWIAVDVTVKEAEGLLDTEYYEHEHTTSSKVRVGCDEYVNCRI